MVKKNFAEAARNHGIFSNDETSRPDPRDYASPTPIGGPERDEQRQQFLRQRKVQRLRDLVHEKLGFVEYPSVISALHTVIQSAPESLVNAIPSQVDLEKMANEVRRMAGQATVPLPAPQPESSGPKQSIPQSSRRLSKNQSVPDLDLMSRRSNNASLLSRSESVKAIQPASPLAQTAPAPASPSQSAMQLPAFQGVDEWTLLVMAQKAQQEAQAQAAAERERAVKAKTSTDLQRQMIEREQLRQKQMEEKQRQLQLMQEQTEQWKREEESRKRSEKLRQQVVRSNLTESLEEKKSSQSQALRSRREEEERLLRLVAQKEMEESQREKEARLRRKEHNDQMRIENEHQEELKRMHRQQEKAEDVRILENYSRMLEEQENQRKHYISSLKRQQDAMEQHAKSRGLEQVEADRMEDERRRLAMLEAERKQAEREQAVAQARKMVAVDTLHALEQQMKSRADMEREQRTQAAVERQRLAQKLAQEQEMEKQKEMERRMRNEQYRGELQNQMQVNQVKKQSDKIMSEEDRKLHASYLRQYAQLAASTSPSNRDSRSSLVSTPFGASIDISTLPKAVALQVQQMGRASPQPYSPTHLFSSSPTANSLASPPKSQMMGQLRLSADEPQSPSAQKYSRNSPFGSMARSMFA